jgi:two-component SAPR family response regulator
MNLNAILLKYRVKWLSLPGDSLCRIDFSRQVCADTCESALLRLVQPSPLALMRGGIMAIVAREEPNCIWSEKSQADWRTACDLLKQAQYDLAAEFLGQQQRESEQAGNVLLADTLAAIRQICLACRQYQAGAEWFWQAYQEASGREDELRQLLSTILELVGERGILEAQARPATSTSPPPIEVSPAAALNTPELAAFRSLWQRLYGLLGWGSTSPPPPAPIAPRPTPEAPVAHLVERLEPPITTPSEVAKEEKSPVATLTIYCLGPFRVWQNNQPIAEWQSLKGQAILKYLVAHAGTAVAKDILMDVFWPEADAEAARRNLHQAIYSLRQTLKRGRADVQLIRFENDCYLLDLEVKLWVDFKEFERHAQMGRQLEAAGQLTEAAAEYSQAEGLYQGDFLEEDLYDDWTALPRERLCHTYLDLADRLSEYYRQEDDTAAAIALCQKILAKDKCHEEAHYRLMQCYQAQGQRPLAVRQYQLCLQVLKTELNVAPSVKIQALYDLITKNDRSLTLAH